jgi:GT2 family glycosyltransferase
VLSVSVVVPIYNAIRTLPSCLAAIERLDPKPLEIVLVDNGSTDGSFSIIQTFAHERSLLSIRVIEESKRGAATARNAGIQAAKGDIVAFMDADCAPDPSWLLHLVEPFGEPEVGAVAGSVLAAPAATRLELFSALYTLQSPDRPARHRRWTPWEGGFPTANFAVRRDLLLQLKGFDEEVVIYGEDYDLCARLYARGASIQYSPEAKIYHYHRTTFAGMLRQAFGFGRSHPYLIRRHASKGLWLELPGRSVTMSDVPIPAWVDLASADKKVMAILILGTLYKPAFFLLPTYIAWLAVTAGRRAKRAAPQVSPWAAMELGALLLAKSFAMTVGRWWGSMKYGVICL